ncbi:MAG: hypothetical protein M3017_17420 [Actinomycetota bacterium]|nr:hypothetical protein [Actinomycetota bacterium]
MHNLILVLATAPPTDTPSLKPGLAADQVGPGFLGFLVTFGIVAIMFFLIRDMVKRIRRVRYRAQVEEGTSAERADPEAAAEGAAERADPEAAAEGAAEGADPQGRAGAGGSHGPDADYLDSRSRDDGRSGTS